MLPHRLGPVNRWDFDEFTYIGRSPPSAQGSTPSCGLFEKNGKKYRGKSDVLLDPLHTLRNALSEMCSNDIYALYGCRAQSMCISEQKWLPGSEVFAEQANMPPSGIHLMCEWIDNLQMFDESWLSSLQSPESPLTVVTADVRQLVVSGLGRVLAVALFLNDIDCLGGRLKNIGYILPTDESGPQVAHVVKIDPGFAFHLCDRHPSTPSHEHIKLLSDSYKSIARAEIKYATALPPLHFYSLPSSVRVEFLETLSLILTTDRGTMRSWFARPGFEPLYPDELGIGVRLQFLQDRMSALHETFGPLMLSPTLSTTSASSTSSITCVSALPTAKGTVLCFCCFLLVHTAMRADGWYYSGKTSKFVLGQVLGFGSTVIAYKATLEGFPVCAKVRRRFFH